MFKQLFKRLSYSYRHQDYYKWIGPEDGYNADGTRKGMEHFVYTEPWYNEFINWIMVDILDMGYSYNRKGYGRFGWTKVWQLHALFKDEWTSTFDDEVDSGEYKAKEWNRRIRA
jgi:hypothetical protein